MKSLFYDLSSSSFEGTKCKLMKWGHCKGGYENHVVLALIVNKNGLPFYWEVEAPAKTTHHIYVSAGASTSRSKN